MDLEKVYIFMNAFWKHTKKFYTSDMGDEENAAALVAATNDLVREFGENDLCYALLMTFLAYKDSWDMSLIDYNKIAKRSEHNEH